MSSATFTLGARVRVPLRTAGRLVDAYVVEIAEEDDAERALSTVDAVTSTVPVLPERLYRLARRVADRAAGSASDILRLVIPKRQVRVEKAWTADAVAAHPSSDDLERARHRAGGVRGARRADRRPRPVRRRGRSRHAGAPCCRGRSCSPPPQPACSRRALPRSSRCPTTATLISCSPPWRRSCRPRRSCATIPGRPIRSATADSCEHSKGAPCIVVGNRSAVYAPVQAGLVAIGMTATRSTANRWLPTCTPADALLVRQEQEGSALLFAGHTRTSDVERLVQRGWAADTRAERRVTPRVVLSSPQEMEQPAQRVHSGAYGAARAAVEEGPVLVQVARPGFAPTLVCAQCRAPARCAHCGGPLGAAHRGAVPVCGWCGRSARAWHCPSCSSTKLRLAASGSERTADELGRAFPGVRVIVADGAHPVESVAPAPRRS